MLDTITTAAVTLNDTRDPQIRRLRTSRPSVSVPSRCAVLPPAKNNGGLSFCVSAICVGS